MTDTVALADLKTFLAIAKAGGITRAGEQLGLQKAVVSKALARLEGDLAVKLFERTTRRFAITPAGVHLQQRAQAILADVDSLQRELRRDTEEVGGTLTIAAPPELGIALTETLFASYLDEHPRVRLSLKLDYGYQDLFDPEIDLAFRVGQIKDDTLVARPLGAFKRVLVAKASFVERWQISKIGDLSRVPCLSFDERTFGGSWVLSDGQRVRTFELDGRFGARSYPAILAAARAGLGVAFLPEFVAAPACKGGDLVRVLPRWASPSVALFLLQRVGQSRLRRVKEFVDHVARTGVFRHLLEPTRAPGPRDGASRPTR